MAFGFKDIIEKGKELAKQVEGWTFDNQTTTEAPSYDTIKLLQDSLANRPTFSAYQNPEKQAEYNAIRQRYLDREFHYDPSADPAAEALRREYINGGRLAMRDTLGTASAATGGLASSYAQQAGQQAYGAYMKDYATSVIPSLKQMARQKYEQETNDILGKLGILQNEMKAESDKNYQEYMANETAWQNELATKLQIAEYKQNEIDARTKAADNAYKEKLDGAKGQLENVFEGLDLSTQDGRAKAAENIEKLVGMYASDAQEAYQLLQDLLGTNYNFTFDDYLKAIEDGYTPVQTDRLRHDSY